MELHKSHMRLLAMGKFYIEGYIRPHLRRSIKELEQAGYLLRSETSNEDYFYEAFTVTDEGKEALTRRSLH